MRESLNVAIIGPGNIGIDLMMKLKRSKRLNLALMAGIIPESAGLKAAAKDGVAISIKGIDGVLEFAGLDLVFDATGAAAHLQHAPKLKQAGLFAVDLTPAAVGPYVVPAVNLGAGVLQSGNVNMVTCGGQATVPVVHAINQVTAVDYAEIVATISSKSAGPGTRQNIDEFTQTTRNALIQVGGARTAKAIIILNPAEPPMMMRNTVYARCDVSKIDEIRQSVEAMAQRLRQYVPGYRLKVPTYADGDRVVTVIEVEGAGDYLPTYSGNLDIITSAAVAVAERYADWKMQQEGQSK
ncbi:MAG TPA: acetaldehyde dehydrogenase (acetylating) [Patescibacteria group bacterium]|nr:acetaldehyde dehydrogenase (acetylating) [Patescibacteria group bacterium]